MQNDFHQPHAPGHTPATEPPKQHIPQVHVHNGPPKGPKGWPERFKRWFAHLNKKQKALFFAGLAVVFFAIGAGAWWLFIRDTQPPPEPPVQISEEPKPTTKLSCIAGLEIPIDSNPLPTGIMIENSLAARPQSGLSKAETVFEAIAEGGITRFLTLFEVNEPTHVGPVRSLRPYYLTFLQPFDAPIAHAGGSAQALAEVDRPPFKNIEAFRYFNYFNRISTRSSPHNLYTNRKNLINLQKDLGWTKSNCKGFAREENPKEPAKTPTAKTINLNISSANYNVRYDYHAGSNSYRRIMGGQKHIDANTNKQIAPKVVVGLVMSHHYAGIYSVYGATGSGQVFIFQNGKVTKGTWHKPSRGSQYAFRDAQNRPLKLNPGQTWVTVVDSPGDVTFTAPPKPKKPTPTQ